MFFVSVFKRNYMWANLDNVILFRFLNETTYDANLDNVILDIQGPMVF